MPHQYNPTIERKDWLTGSLRLTHTISHYPGQKTYAVSGKGKMVRLHFGIKGNYSVQFPTMQKEYELVGGHHNLIYADPFEMNFTNRSGTIETFGIQFPVDDFVQFTTGSTKKFMAFSEKILSDEPCVCAEAWGRIDLSIQNVINEILHCQAKDELKSLFFLSKSLELLVLCAASYEQAEMSQPGIVKTSADRERLIAARDLINQHLREPLTLRELARKTGLNEYKLRKGFRELFGTTVFNYLTSQRLNLALELLKQDEMNISEIGYELGYSTPQHFNNAFRKQFGQTPNMVRKKP